MSFVDTGGEFRPAHDVALDIGRLAIAPREWINRRVERVAYLDESTIRRWISVDFTVPPTSEDGDRPIPYLPLAQFEKRTLTNFDLRGEAGEALPMLTGFQNGTISTGVLLEMGRTHLPSYVDSLTEQYVEQLVFSTREDQRDLAWDRIFQPGTEAEEAFAQERRFITLARDLAENFVLYLPSDARVGERRIVKISFDAPRDAPRLAGLRQRLGWHSVGDSFDVPLAGYGASYHFELEPPAEMAVVRGFFVATRDDELVTDVLHEPVRRAHFNLPGLDRTFGRVYIGLKARSKGLLSGAAMFAVLNLSALIFVRARLDKIVDVAAGGATGAGRTETVVAVLLAVPGLLLGYILRPGEHEVVSAFLRLPRAFGVLSALTSFLAAALLFGGYSRRTLSDLYLGLAVVAGVCAAVLVASWLGQRR